MSVENVAILIPALNPPDTFQDYVEELLGAGFQNIIIVNDGSREEFEPVFLELGKDRRCTVLKHFVNLGKGRGIKNGANYYLTHRNHEIALITVDSDGQHRCGDVVRLANVMDHGLGGCF